MFQKIAKKGVQPNQLKIDNVLSEQPELGPSIPDGGYGWVILGACMFFQALIPSIIVGYGVVMLFARLENNSSLYPTLWDNPLLYAPMLFIATWTIIDPWSRTVISNSAWPRLVGTAGTCLTCAGLLILWIGFNNHNAVLFVISGMFSGTGASIVMSQCDVLISQYFRLKLRSVTGLLYVTNCLGYILTPVVIGNNIVNTGILRVIIWYQAVILQGIVICVAFRKPKYLKPKKRNYKIIQEISDDEDDIFAKNVTELQSTKQSQENSSSNEVEPSTSSAVNGPINTINLAKEIHEATQKPWQKFDDGPKSTKVILDRSFSNDFNNDLNKTQEFEDNFSDIPKPLFKNNYINNNITYDLNEITETPSDEPVVFAPISDSHESSSGLSYLTFLKRPTFYKSLLHIITTKFSFFTFWALFPSYLYISVLSLKVHHTTSLVGAVSFGSLLFGILTVWLNTNSKRRALYLGLFCWIGSLGYCILSYTDNEIWLLVGAVQITLSLNALQVLGAPLLKLGLRGESNGIHKCLSTATGVAFAALLPMDFSYQNCFRLMSILQFSTGSLWFTNFIYKKIRNL